MRQKSRNPYKELYDKSTLAVTNDKNEITATAKSYLYLLTKATYNISPNIYEEQN